MSKKLNTKYIIITVILMLSVVVIVLHTKNDTPNFVDAYIERYNVNNKKSIEVRMVEENCLLKRKYNITCTEKDMEAIKQLALENNTAALAAYPVLFPEDSDERLNAIKYAADLGEVVNACKYAWLQENENFANSKYYYDIAATQGDYCGYWGLAQLYNKYSMAQEFCLAVEKGIEKFSMEFVSRYFTYDSSESQRYFNGCMRGKGKVEILDELNTNEAQLIKGFVYIKEKNRSDTYAIFSNLYQKEDNSIISVNAGACLGWMYVYGKGVEKNIEKGRELFKQSWRNGMYMHNWHISRLENMLMSFGISKIKIMIPEKPENSQYAGNNCYLLKNIYH